MERLYNDLGKPIDMKKMRFLSNEGSEFIVYKYLNLVIKLYKKDYPLSHLSLDELYQLKSIVTKRILLPSGLVWNKKRELKGYEMSYIGRERKIEEDNLGDFLNELETLKQDIELLSRNQVILRDLNSSNTIYNGKLYLVDPGNYLIGEIDKIILHTDIDAKLAEEIKKILIFGDEEELKALTDGLPTEEKQRIVRDWNYRKVNRLLNILLFSGKNNIDPYTHRQIVRFLMAEQEKENAIYNLDIYRKFFNRELTVKEAIDEFVKANIEDNPEEKKLFYKIM